MTNRTVKVTGWGFGEGKARITAVLDGTEVFNGQVDLVDMTERNASEQTAPTLFSFEIPMDFAGTKNMVITVKDTAVRFGYILGNYVETEMGGITYSSGPDIYSDVADYDENFVKDPRSNVTIDGRPQKADRLLGKGTWHWAVNPGSTLKHDLTISQAGLEE
jgi:hypothetical protein